LGGRVFRVRCGAPRMTAREKERGGVLLLSAFPRAMLPPERSGEMAASPIVRGGYGRAGIATLKAAKGITSHQPLATSHCKSNRYAPRLEPPVTHSKQTTVVLSNRYKCRPSEGSASRGKNVTEGSLFRFVPSGGVTSWLTHRPRRPFYPVQRANRNRRKPFKTNDGGIFYSIQKALPPGGG
jgi:hypothetical protein